MTNNYTPQEIGSFIIDHLPGCKFVGLADDGEVFIRFDTADLMSQYEQMGLLRKEFPKITRVSTVVEAPIAQVKEMVDQLNELLEEPSRELLDIEEF